MAVILTQGNSIQAQEVIDVPRLADAIKKAEGSRSHPYGILRDYCSADTEAKCRKGCVQTIHHAGSRYAPVNMGKNSNDPKNLNINWVKNVTYHYEKGVS